MWVFFLSHCKSIEIRCYIYQINAICWIKKTVLNLKKLTRGFLYEMIFVWNEYVKIQVHLIQKILVQSDSYAFVRNGLPCTKWSLFEMVFVRSDCQSLLVLQQTLFMQTMLGKHIKMCLFLIIFIFIKRKKYLILLIRKMNLF